MFDKDKTFLRHILEAIDEIQAIISEREAREVLNDHASYYGILYLLAIIGEASGNVSEELKQSNTEIPWQKIKGMRNVVMHEYFGVDFAVVWATVEKRIPELKKLIEDILLREA